MNDWADTIAARLGDGGPDPSGNDEQMLFRRAVASYLLEDYGAALESLRQLANRSTNPRWLLNTTESLEIWLPIPICGFSLEAAEDGRHAMDG